MADRPTNPQQYYGTKRVAAWDSHNDDGKEGFTVVYADGYQSWSPRDVFLEAYEPDYYMSFGHALHAMRKHGEKARRPGWATPNVSLSYCVVGEHLHLNTVDDNRVVWEPSQTDILANDWYIVE